MTTIRLKVRKPEWHTKPPITITDGGRAAAGFKGGAGDCVTRAIALTTGKPYMEVYNKLFDLGREYGAKRRGRVAKSLRDKGATPRDGVFDKVYKPWLEELGFKWTPLMGIGTGCKVHVREGELPKEGRYILKLSGHLCALIDGVIYDSHDPSRNGTRCVYGYWKLG